jgi:hypothetical protein
MSSLLTQALSVRSDHFSNAQESMHEAVKQSKQGNNDLLRKILNVVFPLVYFDDEAEEAGLTYAQTCPKDIYSFLKQVSKVISPADLYGKGRYWEYCDSGRHRYTAISATLKAAYAAIGKVDKDRPHKSFSISDGDGYTLCVNATAVRLLCPNLMKLAQDASLTKKTVDGALIVKQPADISADDAELEAALELSLKTVSISTPKPTDATVLAIVDASQKPLLRSSENPVASKTSERISHLPFHTSSSPKYSLSQETFPFIELNAFKLLFRAYRIPECTPDWDKIHMSDYLQALVATKILEKSEHCSWDVYAKWSIWQSCKDSFFCHNPNYHIEVKKKTKTFEKLRLVPNLEKNPDKAPLMTDDDIALFVYALFSSKSSLSKSGEEGTKDGALSYFACFDKQEVGLFEEKFLNDFWIPPAQMMRLCERPFFLSAIIKYDFLRRVIIRPDTTDRADLECMKEQRNLWNLDWKVMEAEVPPDPPAKSCAHCPFCPAH